MTSTTPSTYRYIAEDPASILNSGKRISHYRIFCDTFLTDEGLDETFGLFDISPEVQSIFRRFSESDDSDGSYAEADTFTAGNGTQTQ
jgi:hypothetical protein